MKKNIFSFLSQRINERKAVNETVSVSGENKEQKESKFMKDNENKVVEKDVNSVDENKADKKEIAKDNRELENKETEVIEKKDDEVEKEQEKSTETQTNENEVVKDETPNNQVEQTEQTGNGIPLDQVATKDYVKEMLESMNAKYEAILKENEDLKAKLADSNGKITEMQNKYENQDFGNYSNKGVQAKDKFANDTFEEYSKQFM